MTFFVVTTIIAYAIVLIATAFLGKKYNLDEFFNDEESYSETKYERNVFEPHH